MSGYTLSMPISPGLLIEHIGLTIAGSSPWGTVPETNRPGVYAASLYEDPWDDSPHPGNAPISEQLVAEWIDSVPTFALRGSLSPRPRDVVQTLERFWLNNEAIIYIGKDLASTTTQSIHRHKPRRDRTQAGTGSKRRLSQRDFRPLWRSKWQPMHCWEDAAQRVQESGVDFNVTP